MERPFKYLVFCNKTGDVKETNYTPLLHHLQTWEATEDPNVRKLKQTKTVYIDTRYEAKIRLFNYVTCTKKGLPVPKYKPFEGTEIGKSIPILNF